MATTVSQASVGDKRESLDPLPGTDVYRTGNKDWQRSEGMPSLTGFSIEDLKTVELAPWPRRGSCGGLNPARLASVTNAPTILTRNWRSTARPVA
jgi:hypothetical protein